MQKLTQMQEREQMLGWRLKCIQERYDLVYEVVVVMQSFSKVYAFGFYGKMHKFKTMR